MVYTCVTIHPGQSGPGRPTFRRQRLLDLINRQPAERQFTCVIGPIGAGKTALAIQWAEDRGEPVQYVSARSRAEIPTEWISDPTPMGHALADLMNACISTDDQISDPDFRPLADRLSETLSVSRQSFILDDMELLGIRALQILEPLLRPENPELRIDQALILTRTMDARVMHSLKAIASLRIVLPSSMEVDQDEAREAHRLGVFGTASSEQVETERRRNNGWIAGMLKTLHSMGSQAHSVNSFNNTVLNDLLLQQPLPLLRAMITSAYLPVNTIGIWERWFDYLDVPHRMISSCITQLPTRSLDDKSIFFEVVPSMKDSLKSLSHIAVSQELLQQLLDIAMVWYVDHDELAHAVALAEDQMMEPQLLDALKVPCAKWAEAEKWSEIRVSLQSVPENCLINDPELAYWYVHSLMENNQLTAAERIQEHIIPIWQNSPDSLTRGRAHLLRAWRNYTLNRADESVSQGKLAIETLPRNSHRDHSWAAGTVAIAEILRGTDQDSRRWIALANYESAQFSGPSSWWLNNAGVEYLSWLCISGVLEETYDIASRKARSLKGSNYANATRLLILMAQIDIERRRFESAAALLNEAEAVCDTRYAQPHHLRVTRSNLAHARGDFALAGNILGRAAAADNHQFDQFLRESCARSRIYLDAGDIGTAELFLSSPTTITEEWPSTFGDAHPQLLHALLIDHQGHTDRAIEMTTHVTIEARRRHHRQFLVMAESTLAYLHHIHGAPSLRDNAIDQAVLAAGDSGFHQSFVVCGVDVRQLGAPATAASNHNQKTLAQPGQHTQLPGHLTAREVEVLQMASQLLSNKEIAETLNLSVSTVKNHLGSAFTKLGAQNRRTAVHVATEKGLLDKHDPAISGSQRN